MNSGVNNLVSTGAMFSMTTLLRLDEPGSDDDGCRRAARDQPAPYQPLRVHLDRLEHHRRKADEDAPAERDEHVVDGQLAREPHEVHPPLIGEPSALHVREADSQPQGDWQVQSGQLFCVAARVEGKDVGENSPGREGQREPEAACNTRLTLPHEVDRKQRQDEQAGVAEVERFLTSVDPKTEQRRVF